MSLPSVAPRPDLTPPWSSRQSWPPPRTASMGGSPCGLPLQRPAVAYVPSPCRAGLRSVPRLHENSGSPRLQGEHQLRPATRRPPKPAAAKEPVASSRLAPGVRAPEVPGPAREEPSARSCPKLSSSPPPAASTAAVPAMPKVLPPPLAPADVRPMRSPSFLAPPSPSPGPARMLGPASPKRNASFVASPRCGTPTAPSSVPSMTQVPDSMLPTSSASFVAPPPPPPPCMSLSASQPDLQSPPATQRVIPMPQQGRPHFAHSPSWMAAASPLPTQSTADRSSAGGTTPSAPHPQLAIAVPSMQGQPPGVTNCLTWAPPDMAGGQPPLSRGLSFVPPPEPGFGMTQLGVSWVPPPSEVGVGLQPSLSWVPPPTDAGANLVPSLSWIPPPQVSVPALSFVSASASRQHPAKISTGIVNADSVLEAPTHLGICDGVSGVHHLGIPPDELPRDLLQSCGAKLESMARFSANVDDGTWLTGLIEEAFDATEAYGATTLLLATLRDANLVTASLGDCALLVLRPCSFTPLQLRPILKTEPGRYDSRRPVQVQRLHGFSDANAHTVIKGAMVSTTPVQHGDLLVMGSDGLFDNLRDEDIQLAVERGCAGFGGGGLPPPLPDPGRRRSSLQPPTPPALAPGPAQLQRTAEALVELAIARVKLDPPEAERQEPWGAQGGDVPANNADDTTALVAAVVLPDEVDDAGEDEEPLESCAGVINF
mmetsp:Transcript_37913/g.120466  ORF Transcript_37913/g.120466 Transcript_37913/m.120466 type:complete len:712 (+) Transcript_37913:48-2183(+)